MSQNIFSCYLIGNESLLIQCADILRQRNHTIRGIITSAQPIRDWATSQNIPTHQRGPNLVNELSQQPFDYFMSITNLSIIPDEILALPKKGAINFHDGPLPRYAGLYATSWALMNQEKQHGITWHTMTAGVDEGLILKQALFDIAPNETAFTLNVKCYETGIATFGELVDGLANNTIEAQEQDFSERSYFGRYKRPAASGSIRWSDPAGTLSALVRALDFGGYENPLSRAKLLVGQTAYIVPELTMLSSQASEEPGTILGLNTGLQVSTGDYDVAIPQLITLAGQTLSPAEFAMQANVKLGDKLTSVSDEQADELTAQTEALARYESFWVRRLAAPQTVELPYATRNNEVAKYDRLEMVVPAGYTPDHLITHFLTFLARLSGNGQFDVGYHHTGMSADSSLFASHVPLRVNLDLASTVQDALDTIGKQVSRTQKRQSYSLDSQTRYPQLNRTTYPILIEQNNDLANYKPLAGSELTFILDANGDTCDWSFDSTVYNASNIANMQRHFLTFLENSERSDERLLSDVSLLSKAEYRELVSEWNQTEAEYASDQCIHHLFETQVAETPDLPALTFEETDLTYAELNEQANQLAHYLQKRNVNPDQPVGIYMERGHEMVIGLMGILKAGGAYLPLDPTYPADRIAFMVEDAGVGVILTQSRLVEQLPPHNARVVTIDGDWNFIGRESTENAASAVKPHNLAYLIYTSGSTGKPKGVMVEHRNAVNFFVGMDDSIPCGEGQQVWLTVTSLSFDISVLEIFWSLTRGLKLVVFADKRAELADMPTSPHASKPIDFSLFYFASDESEQGVGDKYKLLLEGAKFADQNGFQAVWTPERHFHAFGGLYPNPSVASAAIAAITENVGIRAGSCVLPLHSPIRVTEEWSLVDNISKGRVGISFAAGWQPNDFVLKPENFADRKMQMFRDIEVVKKLWRGETVNFPGALGKDVAVSTLPRPVQAELPIWVTAAGNPETFRMAGEGGFNLLTHLLGQTVEELGEKLKVYREGWKKGGHPGEGHVTLMLHTFIGEDLDEVRDIVREPMKDYLRSAVFLIKQAAWSFPTFKQKAEATGQSPLDVFESEDLTNEEMEALLEFAFNRYFDGNGLFGTPATCLAMINRLKGINVDEIACQIDFGVPSQMVLDHLHHLNELRALSEPRPEAADYSIPALINRHNVTHFQCTPSMGSMLMMDESTHEALSTLDVWMLGGEAFPISLARQLKELVKGKVINMYGPTETTIWSSTHALDQLNGSVSIGRPIANTQLYIVDKFMQPVPIGVPGELLIGGDGVVRGYLNRPELTNERFIPDPFQSRTTHHAPRVYRTGDLVKYLPSGDVEFLGRVDFQVKIRGYRIELGEIESLLNSHETVREAVVVAREDVPGDKRLVAYLLSRPGQTISGQALRDWLRNQLPEFMVPAHFVPMESFPLTPNKKTDRKALPAPDEVMVASEVEYAPPEDDLQATIAEIWQQLLNMPRVGLNDNFFDLGGHSLLTVQAHRMLMEKVEAQLSITDMFRFPTIRSLSDYLKNQGAAAEAAKEKVSGRAAKRREMQQRRRQRRGSRR